MGVEVLISVGSVESAGEVSRFTKAGLDETGSGLVESGFIELTVSCF